MDRHGLGIRRNDYDRCGHDCDLQSACRTEQCFKFFSFIIRTCFILIIPVLISFFPIITLLCFITVIIFDEQFTVLK